MSPEDEARVREIGTRRWTSTAEQRALEQARKAWADAPWGYDESIDAAMRKTFFYKRLLLGERWRDLGSASRKTAPARAFMGLLRWLERQLSRDSSRGHK